MVSTEKREGDRVQKRKPALSCVHSVDDSIYGTFVLLSLQRSISNAKILNSIPTGGFPTSVFNGINIFIFPVPRNTTVPAHTHTHIYIHSLYLTHPSGIFFTQYAFVALAAYFQFIHTGFGFGDNLPLARLHLLSIL